MASSSSSSSSNGLHDVDDRAINVTMADRVCNIAYDQYEAFVDGLPPGMDVVAACRASGSELPIGPIDSSGKLNFSLIPCVEDPLPPPILLASEYSTGYDLPSRSNINLYNGLYMRQIERYRQTMEAVDPSIAKIEDDVYLNMKDRHRLRIGTGYRLAFVDGLSHRARRMLCDQFYLSIVPKSTSFKFFTVEPGIVDLDYTGEIFVKIIVKPYVYDMLIKRQIEKVSSFIDRGQYLAQAVVCEKFKMYMSGQYLVQGSCVRGAGSSGATTKRAMQGDM